MKFKDYYEVREWLESFIPQVYGKENLGLARIEYLLKLLGNPEKKFKSIHVAGTSGKGSTCWYIAKLLEQETNKSVILGSETTPESSLFVDSGQSQNDKKGFKVGLHISPHLVDIRERMQVFLPLLSFSPSIGVEGKLQRESGFLIKSGMTGKGSSLMPMWRFLRLFNEIRPVVEKIKKEKPELTPSYFEILVAASFKYFAEEKVDWAVVEVGLGGRLDATNVLVPEVSVITNIGLDHTEILGKTVEKIAYEKAGIIKKGVPVVTGASGRALEVIADVAKKQQASLVTIDTQDGLLSNKLLAIEAVDLALGTSHLSFPRKRESRDWILDQVENDKKGLPGRFEEIEPGVILDGAHNPDKIRALLEFIGKSKVKSQKSKVGGVILVVGFKKGKQWKKMVDLLIKNLPIKQVIATKFHAVTDTGPPRLASGEAGRFAVVEPEEIADYVKSKWKVKVESWENSQEAVFEAVSSSVIASTFDKLSVNSAKQSKLKITASFDELRTRNDKRLVLVTGSLYLVGEVRTMWQLPHF